MKYCVVANRSFALSTKSQALNYFRYSFFYSL